MNTHSTHLDYKQAPRPTQPPSLFSRSFFPNLKPRLHNHTTTYPTQFPTRRNSHHWWQNPANPTRKERWLLSFALDSSVDHNRFAEEGQDGYWTVYNYHISPSSGQGHKSWDWLNPSLMWAWQRPERLCNVVRGKCSKPGPVGSMMIQSW